MKIATLQGALCAFLKMTEKDDCDGALLHCCILLFPPAVSPQNALRPLFPARARMYSPRENGQPWAQKLQIFPLCISTERRKTGSKSQSRKSSRRKGRRLTPPPFTSDGNADRGKPACLAGFKKPPVGFVWWRPCGAVTPRLCEENRKTLYYTRKTSVHP